MHRHAFTSWTARFLLLFAFVGTLAPLALAVTAAPPHACCLRTAAHHCHDSAAAASDHLSIRDSSCCPHNCSRAVTTSQSAHPQPWITAGTVRNTTARRAESHQNPPAERLLSSLSTRAPPSVSLA